MLVRTQSRGGIAALVGFGLSACFGANGEDDAVTGDTMGTSPLASTAAPAQSSAAVPLSTSDGAPSQTAMGTPTATSASSAPPSETPSGTGTGNPVPVASTAPAPVVIPTVGMPAACENPLPMADASGAVHTLTVDTAASWGELPHFWDTYGTGQLGLYLREDRQWGETLKAHTIDGIKNLGLKRVRQHGLFADDIGIYHEVDGIPVYDFTNSDKIFDFFNEQQIRPIVELGTMPRDMAADPTKTVFDYQAIISIPKDFALWEELVFKFVEHSVERYGADVVSQWDWEVWNEPECCKNKFWSGTLEQYHELYDHSAKAVRTALPGARVGGPVSSQPQELTSGSFSGQKFLEHVTTDNYAIPGSPAGVDFFAYHSWSFIGGAVDGYFQGLDLLDSFGLNDVKIAITEFGPTYEFGLYDEPQETSQGAAFVAQTYADISQRSAKENRRFPITYSWWTLSDIFEEGMYREDEPFIGCMGLISREGIKKPAYNAYKFLAQMGNEQVALETATPGGVGGMAAKDANGGVQVIVYNGQNPGLGPKDDKYYEVAPASQVAVTVKGLKPDLAYDVIAYRVDETHGNAYAAWQSKGRPTMAAMSEADWQSLRDVMESQAESVGQAACGETFTQTFDVPSPGVLFVQFIPALR